MTQQIKPLPPELTVALVGLGGRKLVLVEGLDDVYTLEQWFLDRLPDIEFYPAGGHNRVKALLEELAEQRPDVNAFGIQDRDFQSDLEVANALNTPSSRRFILPRYELENYLLEPDAVHEELRTYYARAKTAPLSTEIEQKLLQLCEQLTPVVAANWLLSEVNNGAEHFDDGFPNNRILLIREVANKIGCTEEEADSRVAAKEASIQPCLTSLSTAHTRIKGKFLFNKTYNTYIFMLKQGLPKDSFRSYLVRAVARLGLHQDITTIIDERILSADR